MVPLMVFPADAADSELHDRIAVHLRLGGILGHPTETVYGLGAAANAEGTAALRSLKGRESAKPFLVLLPEASPGDGPLAGEGVREPVDRWGLSWPPTARSLAAAFWPGPLTLVVLDPEGRFPPGVRNEEGGVAVRMTPHPFMRAVLERWDHPLLSTSANRPDDPPAMSGEEVLRVVEGRPGIHRFWLADGGRLPPSRPSTLIDCTGTRPRMLREGAIALAAVADVVPELDS